MNKRILLPVLLFIVLAVTAGLLFYRSRVGNPITDNLAADLASSIPVPTLVYNPNPEQAAWIPDWGSSAGLSSLQFNQANLPQFGTISPVWYEVNPDGSLKNTYPANRVDLTAYLKQQKISIIPTISMQDHDLFSKVLEDPANLQRHINAIINTVVANNYDGIDLDYESTSLADKALYFQMLQGVAAGLHQKGKLLIVTVVPKWGDSYTYASLPETRQVQDWAVIKDYADKIRIMAYDYTYNKDKYPGPIAPSDWVRQVLNYALTKAPASKFILGIPLYAYQWESDAANPDFNYTVNFMDNITDNSSAAAYQYLSVQGIIQDNPDAQTSIYQDESLFRYTRNGKKYALTYFTPWDIKAHVDLAREYGLYGVCYWRLGNEGTLLSAVSK